jgi:acyl-CoA synthetase (NDP forming)
MFTAESVAEALIPEIETSPKPVVVALMGSLLTERAADTFLQARVTTYPFPERAASALGALVRRAEYLARTPSDDAPAQGMNEADSNLAPGTDRRRFPGSSARTGSESPARLARTPDEAASLPPNWLPCHEDCQP